MRTLALTSGKGGVGKTNLTVNLSLALGHLGRRVLIVDGDVGLANLDVVLGVSPPYTLQHVLRGETSLEQALHRVTNNVRVLAGGSGAENLLELKGPIADKFLTQLQAVSHHVDDLIFDTGAGIDGNVMLFLESVDQVLLVATPDPSSLTDAYATAKSLFARRPEADVRLIVNMVEDERQAELVFGRLLNVVRQFLKRDFLLAGSVRQDPRAVACIRAQKPFYLADPSAPASRDVAALARGLIGASVPARLGVIDRLRSLLVGSRVAS